MNGVVEAPDVKLLRDKLFQLKSPDNELWLAQQAIANGWTSIPFWIKQQAWDKAMEDNPVLMDANRQLTKKVDAPPTGEFFGGPHK